MCQASAAKNHCGEKILTHRQHDELLLLGQHLCFQIHEVEPLLRTGIVFLLRKKTVDMCKTLWITIVIL